jgi:hypothetical protein
MVAGIQGRFEASGEWLVRSINGFGQTHDQRRTQEAIARFLNLYRHASLEKKQKLEAIWREAGLGDFPKEPSE